MGAREWLHEHPKVAIAGGCVIVAAAIGLVVAQVLASRRRYPAGPPDSYFTVDDGKTFFVDGGDKVPPYDYKGQQAMHALVFQCGGEKFVGYMERFTPQYHGVVVAHGLTPEAERFGREVKRPGDAKWTSSGDLRAEAQVEDVKCPNGGTDVPVAIEP